MHDFGKKTLMSLQIYYNDSNRDVVRISISGFPIFAWVPMSYFSYYPKLHGFLGTDGMAWKNGVYI